MTASRDMRIAARLAAADPGLGGILLRNGDLAADAIVAELRAGLRADAPIKRIPAHIDDSRLLGGIDLTATLALGRPVTTPGLLAEANGGAIIIPMAERLDEATIGRLTAIIDRGAVHDLPARFAILALDDGRNPEEAPAEALRERLAFHFDAARGDTPEVADPATPLTDDATMTMLVEASAALGIASLRAPILAMRAARGHAALLGRDDLRASDLAFALRTVLAPRATNIPAAPDATPDEAPPPPESGEHDGEQQPSNLQPPEDVILAAAMATLPRDVLAQVAMAHAARARRAKGGGAGARRKSALRGRPLGAISGIPGGGRRLALIDTLRAAAPWQRLRTRTDRIKVRREDLRVRRFRQREIVLTVFCVDASGSSALARLAEAKGAVERLLAEAYVKRAEVALVAFRGTGAEVLLPPTRSLTRARRQLADLPGGGGTPLAAGLNAARDLAESARARGRTPILVVLTDGRANIAADGRAVREQADADAQSAARAIAAAGLDAVFIDISQRPRAEGAALAKAMMARYLPLPRAESAALAGAIAGR